MNITKQKNWRFVWTSNIDLIRDFTSDRNTTRILEINCEFDDQYILGHARRIGLISDQTAVETLVKLLPSIRMI